MRFGLDFKTSPAFWLNLQTRYDLELMESREAQPISRDVHPLESPVAREAYTPVRSLHTQKSGWSIACRWAWSYFIVRSASQNGNSG
jgi:hypothetical protein